MIDMIKWEFYQINKNKNEKKVNKLHATSHKLNKLAYEETI